MKNVKLRGNYAESPDWTFVDPLNPKTFPKLKAKVLIKLREEAFVLFDDVRERLHNPDYLVFGYRCSPTHVAILFSRDDVDALHVYVEAVEMWKATGQTVKEL